VNIRWRKDGAFFVFLFVAPALRVAPSSHVAPALRGGNDVLMW
jgi:hypothetical protein